MLGHGIFRLMGARRGWIVATLVLSAAVLLWAAGGARAATTWTVASTSDDSGTTACNASNSTCPTLRDAINNSGDGDTVIIPAGTYTLTNGELAVNHDLTIDGAGANVVTISGNNSSRIFDIGAGVTAAISGVTVTDGSGSGSGGGIFVSFTSTLTLTNSTVSNSVAPNGGGGIEVEGTAMVSGTTVTGNSAPQEDSCACGGGIDVESGTLNISNSTITGNGAGFGTGEIRGGDGGGVYDSGTATFTNVTIASNSVFPSPSATTPAGANVSVNDTTEGGFQNTIIAYPQGGANCDTSGVFPASGGNNLEDDSAQSCQFNAPSDQSGVDPKLGPLADNGGPTETMALGAGSPAIDKGATLSSITTDQRGGPRPQPPGGAYDIGAYEVGAVADMAISGSGSPNPVIVGQAVTYSLKATNDPSTDPAYDVVVTDKLPSAVTFKSASASQGSCSFSSGTVTCNLGTIVHADSVTITITVTANSPGSVTNTASVASSALDPNSSNNSVNITTQVQAAAAKGRAPVAVTGGANGIGFTFGTVHGSINPEGAATSYYFQYGRTKSYGSHTSTVSGGSGSSSKAVSRTLHGLRPGTVYHYRIVAQSANGTAFGSDRTFRTPQRPSLHVRPSRVVAGATVRVYGNAGACPRGDTVTLLSPAFSSAHEFAGVNAIFARVGSHGSYSTTTTIPSSRAAGHYRVGGRCGGGNLGVSATLSVIAPAFTG